MEEIVSFLISEGYADDHKAASKIYEAMSDEWLEFILCERDFMFNYAKDPADREFARVRYERAKKDPKTGEPEEGSFFSSLRKSPSTGITATGQTQSAPRTPGVSSDYKDMSNQTTQGKTRRN